MIDFGPSDNLTERQVQAALFQSLPPSLDGDAGEFADAISRADEILYLADNAGEIVFDRLLIERLTRQKVAVVVRGAPVSNDATPIDAENAGLTRLVEVIDNGSDAPGTILDDCSDAFRKRFDNADLIIAKGQGNYESLSDVERDIYFLLKAKCGVIAIKLGCDVGALVLRHSAMSATSAVARAAVGGTRCKLQ
jgi:uncharacterized protein with ATP-grasp and redox domains